jgi:crotonobetainyl-CoA:carnitine CoA-transferase CaiB-like acyl-CoA transferase
MEELGLDYESLSAINPRLIVTSITPFGQTGPYRDYKGVDMIAFHMGGTGYSTPGDIQDPDNQPPLKAPGHEADTMASIAGAAGTMCAIMNRDFTGKGEHVDVSRQEVITRVISNDLVSQTHKGVTPTRISSLGRSVAGRKTLLAKDGYYTIQPDRSERTWADMMRAMGNPDWAEMDMFKDREERRENMDVVIPLIEEWSKDYTRDELFELLQVQGHIPYLAVNSIEDAITHSHYVARGSFVETEHPQIGKFKMPGPPYRFPATPWRIASPAPTLGQHNKDIICDRLGYSKEDLVRMRQFGAI